MCELQSKLFFVQKGMRETKNSDLVEQWKHVFYYEAVEIERWKQTGRCNFECLPFDCNDRCQAKFL